MDTIKEVLIRRDEMTAIEAEELIEEATEQFNIYLEQGMMAEAENICQEFFGLEPDYLFEIIN